ncbi:DMT family transporter [Humitalea sp. 24SJ18S-53]|uniref:DMT family transporter n=1 Tax=Humitalea sp. 24SJ18S-53 TaxID=3422307 RepID=UPI003D67D31C
MTPPQNLTGVPLWWRLLVIGFFWGASFPVLRLVAGVMHPFALAGVRGAISGLAIWAFLAATGAMSRPAPGLVRHMLVVGTLNGWLPNVMTAMALGRIEAAPAALIQSAAPLWVGLLSAFLLAGERPGRLALAGLVLGFCGIAVIMGPGALEGGASLEGALLMLATAFSYALGTVYVRAVRPSQPAMLALGQQVVAAAVALALAVGFGPLSAFDQPAWVWGTLAVLAVFASALPLAMFTILLTRARATEASMVGYLQPLSAALIAALWLAEWPAPQVLLGGALVMLAVWLGTAGRR